MLAIIAMGGVTIWLLSMPRVTVSPAVVGPAVQAVYATGSVEPVYWSRVGPLYTGRIVSFHAEEGQQVHQGDVLARLDDEEARARVAELEARQSYLSEQVRRVVALRKTGAASQQALDQVVSDERQTAASLTAGRKRLAEMVLRSPLQGTVLRRDGEIGETVREGQTVFWVGAREPLWVTGEVDEEDIPLVAVGQKVLVKVDAFPNEIVQGRVSEITPKGDAVQRVYRIRVMLPAGTKLRVGMTTETNVIVRENEAAILVPASAVRNDRIFIVADGRIRARAVRTGAIGSRFIEIRDGVSVGETVVFRPTSQIRDGMRVRPVERAPDNGPSVSGRL